MDSIQSDESLRVWMINHLSETLGSHAILKGGMVLRVLDCPRYTNDLDYVFIPFQSKKEIVPLVLAAMAEFEGVKIDYRFHSTMVRFTLEVKNRYGLFKTLLEASVADHCDAQPLSTGDFAVSHQQLPHVIRVMRFDVALAHKLAAWNERRLVRDLYDAYFIFKNLNELPNIEVLQRRLDAIQYARGPRSRTLPRRMGLPTFLSVLEEAVDTLTAQQVEQELRDSMTLDQLAGLEKKIQIALHRLIETLRNP